MSEIKIQREIMLDQSAVGNRAFRNNVGTFKTMDGRFVKTGLGNGTSDLIGFTVAEITPCMVGMKVAIFTAIEVKTPDAGKRLSKKQKENHTQQQNFIEFIKRSGGLAGIAWTVDMARDIASKINLPKFER